MQCMISPYICVFFFVDFIYSATKIDPILTLNTELLDVDKHKHAVMNR